MSSQRKEIFSRASRSLHIEDPYIGSELFDRIDNTGIDVPLRIVTKSLGFSPSYYKAFQQKYADIELRIYPGKDLHDRFVFIDRKVAYHIGHSLKDLGKKDTRISKIADVSSVLGLFDERWAAAKTVS